MYPARPERRPVDRHPASVYLARLAPGSRRTMLGALDTMARMLTNGGADAWTLRWEDLRYPHTAALRAALAARYQITTANKHLAALRGVLREAWRLGLVSIEDFHRAADVQAVRGSVPERGRALDRSELAALFAACRAKPQVAGARDAALLAVAYGCGLRRSELVTLDRSDFDPASGTLSVRFGKGNMSRTGHLPPASQRAVLAWLGHRGDGDGPLFLPVNKAGRITVRRMTPQAVLDLLRRLARAAGVGRFSPHDLRRTFVTDLLAAGVDLLTVQQLAGHAHIETTARYDRRGDAIRRRAAARLDPPYEP